MKQTQAKVAIIGAGWAGLSAAVSLVHQAKITIFEAGREAGGRARKVILADKELDNGQHILLGAYQRSLNLMRRVGVSPEQNLLRLPLVWSIKNGIYLRCPKVPAPLHLALALLSARGINWTEKFHMARALQLLKNQHWQIKKDCSVDEWLSDSKQTGALREHFWQPLVLSALNTPLEQASLATLAQVMADSLGSKREHSDLLIPRCNLSALFTEPSLNWLKQQGATLNLAHRVKNIQPLENGVLVDKQKFDALIIAVAPYHLAALLPNEPLLQQALAAEQFNPISTIYLQYKHKPKLSLPMCGLSGGTAHWLFDKEYLTGEKGMLAGLISCTNHEIKNDELIEQVINDVKKLDKRAESPLWARVITEQRATFAASVQRTAIPNQLANLPRIYLAGDFTHPKYPATLEGAVQSGESAAQKLLAAANFLDFNP